jgi:hypothetical protein
MPTIDSGRYVSERPPCRQVRGLFAAVLETNECVIPWVDDRPFRSKWPANVPTRAFRKNVGHPPDIDSRGADRRPSQAQGPVDGALLGSRRC